MLNNRFRKKNNNHSGLNSNLIKQYDPLRIIIENAKNQPILNEKEEKELIRKYQEHNTIRDYQVLMITHLKLVLKLAFKYYRSYNSSLFDLIQEGNLGLAISVKKFDLQRDVRFSTYASYWIKAYMLRFLRENQSLIRTNDSKCTKKFLYNLSKAKEKLDRYGENSCDYSKLSKELNINRNRITEMELRINRKVISLDQKIKDDSHTTISDLIRDKNINIEEDFIKKDLENNLKTKLQKFYQFLNKKEKIVWDQRIITDTPLSLYKIGINLNLSRERIRQIELEIKNKTKRYLKKQRDFKIQDYLQN